MQKVLLVALLCVGILGSEASAKVVKDQYIGCLTEEQLDEMTTAIVRKDQRQMNVLINKVCFFLKGFEFSVVDQGFMTSKIRVYAGEDSVLLWAPTEATR